MPTTAPVVPTYLYQVAVPPASTATRGRPAGSTESRQAASWASKTWVQGMDTTRVATPRAARRSWACRASSISEPVAISTARAPTMSRST